jgi:heme oxygenase (mycobilin-producing)
VASRDLWEPLVAAVRERGESPSVKGQSGDRLNDLVDRLAVRLRRARRISPGSFRSNSATAVRHGIVGHDEHMTVIKINAITVPADTGDELAHRFAARAGDVDNADGFEGFELLKPTDGREQWLVLTRWRDEESFQAWLSSDSFAHGHRSAAERRGEGAPPPVATHSEVWSYVRAGGSSSE